MSAPPIPEGPEALPPLRQQPRGSLTRYSTPEEGRVLLPLRERGHAVHERGALRG